MTFEQAKALLNACHRTRLVDKASGDCEYTWTKGVATVAVGYIGPHVVEVVMCNPYTKFVGNDALALFKCCKTFLNSL